MSSLAPSLAPSSLASLAARPPLRDSVTTRRNSRRNFRRNFRSSQFRSSQFSFVQFRSSQFRSCPCPGCSEAEAVRSFVAIPLTRAWSTSVAPGSHGQHRSPVPGVTRSGVARAASSRFRATLVAILVRNFRSSQFPFVAIPFVRRTFVRRNFVRAIPFVAVVHETLASPVAL